ncbi:MAG: hypothetical protein U9O56_01305 [Campylobacterota bacterium]|nr:hypothetical protein [Campylobacterota bacterium]
MVRIFVEGEEDKKFIIKLFLFLKKNGDITFEENVNFDDYITEMNNKSKLLNIDSYINITPIIKEKVTKVLFIFDSDFEKDNRKCNGIEKSKECFNNLKDKLDWDVIYDNYIFHRNLDYFIAETIEKEHCLLQIEECLELNTLKPNRKPLAALYGIMYPKAPYNLEHQNFNELKQKLKNLFK